MSEFETCRSFDGSKSRFPRAACVDGFHFTDADLKTLVSAAEIQVLDLTESQVTDEGLEVLQAFSSLERLYLTSVLRITDAGLRAVCDCPTIKELCILDTSVTDDGLQHLLRLTRLECLRIGTPEMDGSGLAHLHSQPTLRCLVLDIHYNDETRALANALQAARPNLVINW